MNFFIAKLSYNNVKCIVKYIIYLTYIIAFIENAVKTIKSENCIYLCYNF